MDDLFSASAQKRAPLADRMRPRSLDEFIGQRHIVGKGKLLRRAIETDSLTSSIFFGPPGCGKTTLASIVAEVTKSNFVKINAVSTGVKEMRAIIEQAETDLRLYGKATYVLLDECHRWTRAQSDTILPALEVGSIRFVGSTTENPMVQAVSAWHALEQIGMPEARLSISQAIIYICESPKSNSVLSAISAAMNDVKDNAEEPVPIHLRDTAYKGAAKLGHGKGYKYAHDYPGHYMEQEYMPPSVKGHRYYYPSDMGQEKSIQDQHKHRGKDLK